MNLLLGFLLAFLAVVGCALQNGTETVASEGDEDWMRAIDRSFEVLFRSQKPDAMSRMGLNNRFFEIFTPTIDKTCILTELKKRNLVEKLSKGKLNALDDRNMADWLFIVIAIQCSSKFDDLLEHTFENTMTYSILWRAFKDEPQFGIYSDMMICANSYAIKNRIWDVTDGEINYEVSEEKRATCDNHIREAEGTLAFIAQMGFLRHLDTEDGTKCFAEFFKRIGHFGLKNFLKLQLKLSGDRLHHERVNFKKEAHGLITEFLSCGRN